MYIICHSVSLADLDIGERPPPDPLSVASSATSFVGASHRK